VAPFPCAMTRPALDQPLCSCPVAQPLRVRFPGALNSAQHAFVGAEHVFVPSARKASSRLQGANIDEKKVRHEDRSDSEPHQPVIAWGHGDQDALDALAPRVQQELHRVAARQMAGERPGHILGGRGANGVP
jgi:hypothetical protein